jgi:light-regulated signal transduction histidine kinase (bacteriophytochrome)
MSEIVNPDLYVNVPLAVITKDRRYRSVASQSTTNTKLGRIVEALTPQIDSEKPEKKQYKISTSEYNAIVESCKTQFSKIAHRLLTVYWVELEPTLRKYKSIARFIREVFQKCSIEAYQNIVSLHILLRTMWSMSISVSDDILYNTIEYSYSD